MRLSLFIALLMAYVIGCLAVAFVAVSALELIVGDLGQVVSLLLFSTILIGLVSQATWVFNPLILSAHAKEHARTEQPVAAAGQSEPEHPRWSNRSE